MKHRRHRILGHGRIVALVVIGLLLIGLVNIGIDSDDDRIGVPGDAQAGDLTLDPCTFEGENGEYAAECGTLVVPETPDDPQSRLIALPVTRVLALDDEPKEPIFYLEGGPGVTNMTFIRSGRFVAERDLVMVGYRGVDGSVQLECPEVDSVLARSADWLTEEAFQATAGAYRDCAERLTDDGIDLASYGLVTRIADLEAARTALGYDRIDLLSESAGTRTAMIYAWTHPERVHRSVMIGVNPPGHYLWDPEKTGQQIGRYAALCAEDIDCRTRTDDLAASIADVGADMPDRWLFLPIDASAARVFSFFGLMESTTEAGLSNGGGAPFTIDAWLAAADGDPSGLWLLSAMPDFFVGEFPWTWGERAAAARLDANFAEQYFVAATSVGVENLGHAANSWAWSDGLLAGGWPPARGEDDYDVVRTSEVETLLISGELDMTTPPQVARDELLPYLPNGQLVVLPGIGHTASFYEEQPTAGSHLINAFLDSGVVDQSFYRQQGVDFAPTITYTAMAKWIVTALIGLTAVAIVALAAMAILVYRRGAFGWKVGAVLRSLVPLFIGLGGWTAATMITMAWLEGVTLGDAIVVVPSVGLPIGLGLYLAWVQRSLSARAKLRGLAAAAGGSLMGALVGLWALDGPLSIGTSILGATLIGNLALMAVDIAADVKASRPEAGATPAPELPLRVAKQQAGAPVG